MGEVKERQAEPCRYAQEADDVGCGAEEDRSRATSTVGQS